MLEYDQVYISITCIGQLSTPCHQQFKKAKVINLQYVGGFDMEMEENENIVEMEEQIDPLQLPSI